MIEFSVDFTDLTFGEDVARHLEAHSRTICSPWTFAARLLKMCTSTTFSSLAMLGALGFMLLKQTGLRGRKSVGLDQFRSQFDSIKADDPFTEISQKVEALFNLSTSTFEHILDKETNTNEIIPVFVIMAIVILMHTFSENIHEFLTKSFVMMNKKTKELCDKHVKQLEYLKWSVYIGSFVAIVTGIISARLDKLLFG